MRAFVLAVVTASMSSQAGAQDAAEAELFSKGHYAGPSINLAAPTSNMQPLLVKSLRIPPGSVWDLCSGSTFSGCERFTESKPAMARTVRSVRPVAAPISESATISTQTPVAGSGPSLRGLASEFFVVPAQGGQRIEVVEKSAGAASAAATTFCRAHGWRISAYERVQTVQGRTFLADVLCGD